MERFFIVEPPTPPLLLRRTETADGLRDEVFWEGRWEPTVLIIDSMFGNDDDVDPVSEEKARALAPGRSASDVRGV